MNISLISGLIFVAVFAGVVFIHELGHFLAARLFKVEVEEFGFGLPPRALTLWRTKGWVRINDRRLEVPGMLASPLEGLRDVSTPVTVTAEEVKGRLVLASLEYEEEARPRSKGSRFIEESLRADSAGNIVQEQEPAPQKVKRVAGRPGAIVISGRIVELHQGTAFTLNWLPLGGFVRPKGENDPAVPGGLAASSPWVRLGVLTAGPLMNLLAGVLVNSMLFAQMGVPDLDQVILYEVMPDSPAAQAGLQVDDRILSVDGAQVQGEDQFRESIRAHMDQPMQIAVQRGDDMLEFSATPRSDRSAEEGALGILPGPPLIPAESYLQTIPFGAMYTYDQIRLILSLPAQILRGSLSPEEGRFIGLKGIYDLFGQAVSRDVESRELGASGTPGTAGMEPTNFTIQLIASLTIMLGIFNLLPFPALDGGRIIFVLPELVLRRRIPAEYENLAHTVGFVLLLLFMVYINAMDFINPVNVNLP